MKFFFIILVSLVAPQAIFAQQGHYSLEQCIEAALKDNLQVTQRANQAGRDAIAKRQARLDMLPSLNASAGHGWYFGRSIDNTTNAFVDNNIYSGDYNLSGGVTLFRGMNLQHTARQAVMTAEASNMSWQQQKDNITLNVILAYLQMMSAQDMLSQTNDQAILSDRQVKRLKDMDAKGAIAPSDLFDMQGQYASDQATIINARRDVETARITICTLMNIPYDSSMVFERIAVTDILERNTANTAEAYQAALKHFAQVRAAEFSVKSAVYGLKAARSKLFPTLNFGYGMNSRYAQSSSADLTEQLKNNNSKSLGFTLSVPIFNNLQTQNNIKIARLNLKEAEQNNQAVKTQLQQNIEGAAINMNAAFDRYQKLQERVNALQQSYRAAEARFNVGQWNSVEYLTVKNSLDRANIDLIGGKYEYLLRVKIYNYYQGITGE
ncbi:TolC family protein [Niabella drilacis]|uniref:Outer membrane protein n=1 Tax=Niabella drilacis (strain DSM 25811 / CCM 8410 / CCUG 62505 / LMG 26954 / E90) TaxID=1285928 RepID=A0A1G7AIF6_NIADE|nr:TolC family protein [Niabella drilacis]SDE14718.1 outer membrane protein [Niabella drilacis]